MPYTETGLPFAPGAGAHTSRKAAVHQRERGRGPKTRRYLALLYERGPLTDHEAREALELPLSSINSIRNNAMDCGLVGRGVAIRKSPYGEDCFTWCLTTAGRSAVETWQRTEAA